MGNRRKKNKQRIKSLGQASFYEAQNLGFLLLMAEYLSFGLGLPFRAVWWQ